MKNVLEDDVQYFKLMIAQHLRIYFIRDILPCWPLKEELFEWIIDVEVPVEKQQRLRRDIDSSLFLFTYFRCCSGHTDVDKRTFLSYNSFLLHIPTNIFNEIKFFSSFGGPIRCF